MYGMHGMYRMYILRNHVYHTINKHNIDEIIDNLAGISMKMAIECRHWGKVVPTSNTVAILIQDDIIQRNTIYFLNFEIL